MLAFCQSLPGEEINAFSHCLARLSAEASARGVLIFSHKLPVQPRRSDGVHLPLEWQVGTQFNRNAPRPLAVMLLRLLQQIRQNLPDALGGPLHGTLAAPRFEPAHVGINGGSRVVVDPAATRPRPPRSK